MTPWQPTSSAREEVVLAARHAHHRRNVDAAAVGDLRLDRLEAGARVLHVEDDELGARVPQHLRDTGREELEHHGAEDHLPADDPLSQGFACHLPSLPPLETAPATRRPSMHQRRASSKVRSDMPVTPAAA
jgi:hypothetical protein